MTSGDGGSAVRGTVVGTLAALVTATAHSLGGAGHSLGGAGMPSEQALVILVLVCGGIGWSTAAMPTARWIRVQLALTLVLAQAVGHVVLTIVDGHHHGASTDHRMLTAHAVAAVVGAALIRGAEVGASTAASALRRVLPRLGFAPLSDAPRPFAPTRRTPSRSRHLDLSGCGTRGPPALV